MSTSDSAFEDQSDIIEVSPSVNGWVCTATLKIRFSRHIDGRVVAEIFPGTTAAITDVTPAPQVCQQYLNIIPVRFRPRRNALFETYYFNVTKSISMECVISIEYDGRINFYLSRPQAATADQPNVISLSILDASYQNDQVFHAIGLFTYQS